MGKEPVKQVIHQNFNIIHHGIEMLKKLKPDLVVIAVPPLEQKKILYYLLKNKIQFYVKNH